MYIRNDLSGIQTFFQLHPGRWTAGTYSHHPFRKENDLNQTFMIIYMFHVNLPGFSSIPSLKPTNPLHPPIPSIGTNGIFTYMTWLDFHGFHVGKLNQATMDAMIWILGPGVFSGRFVDPSNQALDGFGHIAQHGPWKLQMTERKSSWGFIKLGLHSLEPRWLAPENRPSPKGWPRKS